MLLPRGTHRPPTASGYDPLAVALASIGRGENAEAPVPSVCYAKTDGGRNSCWTCHTEPVSPNAVKDDWELQVKYDFPDLALENHWTNLFEDRSARVAALNNAEVLRYVRVDNYAPLRRALQQRKGYRGFVPDLDLDQGFDDEGFAVDGSGWRAVRYKPFPGAFWPTNGSTDDAMVRLPVRFRQDEQGTVSREIYKINLSILEAAVAADPNRAEPELDRSVEPLNEETAGIDLDRDGQVGGTVNRIRGLPSHYVGAASDVAVHRYLFPKGVEFLHSVRYIDPDAPSLMARRMKELRYSRKVRWLDAATLKSLHEDEGEEEEGGPSFDGSPQKGLLNGFGWRLQGFIEDAKGRLRLQTEEEHRFCMGCHGSVGVTVDYTFTLARKVPGAAGWRPQDIRGMADVPQAGHAEPEVLPYFRRAGGGDAFRSNEEISRRFFPGGRLDAAQVLRAAPGGDQDLAFLLAPSRERALALNKAYMVLVRSQSLERGRDPSVLPVANVHRRLEKDTPTELEKAGRIFKDGRLWLQWE